MNTYRPIAMALAISASWSSADGRAYTCDVLPCHVCVCVRVCVCVCVCVRVSK